MPLKPASKLLEGLNTEQAAAVMHDSGPLLIVAGAGTGKTTVITRRIAWLIEQGLAKPGEILALTFTDKAATEMQERIDKLLPYGYLDMWISTFHSFCGRILDQHALDIGLPVDFEKIDEKKAWALVRKNLERFDLDYYRPLSNPGRFIAALIKHFSRAKDELITPEDYQKYAQDLVLQGDNDLGIKGGDESPDSGRVAEVARAYATYQKLLLENSALDFGDLIFYTNQLFRKRAQVLARYQRQFKYILIDEFQDTNVAQFELVRMLCEPARNITVVGDDDQSIYKFRGASVSNILKFQEIYRDCRQITLTQNYRSYQNLLDLSYKFIQANNPDRLEEKLKISKKLAAARKGKGIFELDKYPEYHAEAAGTVEKILKLKSQDKETSWNDFAILVRANDTAEVFAESLERARVPYIHLSRKGLYRKAVIADVIAYFQLLDNYHESRALYRVMNLKKFDFSHDDLATILDYSRRKTYSLYEALKHPQLVTGLSKVGQEGVRKLLSAIEKHTATARQRPVSELFVEVVTELGLGLGEDEAQQIADLNYLDQFNRKLKDFAVAVDRKLLADFMAEFAVEQEAGEQGALDFDPDAGPEAVKIITVHSAKGLEFRHVFLAGLVMQKFPAVGRSDPIELPEKLIKDLLPSGDFHIQEERRLFYVAMTRARDSLYFSYAADYGGTSVRRPSVFIKELGLAPAEEHRPTGEVIFTPTKKAAGQVKLKLPKSFSFTSISDFVHCSIGFKYKHILNVPEPGKPVFSFGRTIHVTMENYLKQYLQQNQVVQGDLFAPVSTKKEFKLPPLEKLMEFYEKAWVDEWYVDKTQKEGYRKEGKEILKRLYEYFQSHPPRPKYLEKKFNLNLNGYLFTGKLDRLDESENGAVIVDYKTGSGKKRDIVGVDAEQLIIYQWAAQDFLREKVVGLQYWYLKDRLDIKNFIAEPKQIKDTKIKLFETIEKIVYAVTHDDFEKYHRNKHQDCKYS
jgi:DNA helicase-2/ATP-dependent DNA helicase PcrA